MIPSPRAAEARLGTKIPIIPAGIHYELEKVWQVYLTFGEAIDRDETNCLPQTSLKSCLSQYSPISAYDRAFETELLCRRIISEGGNLYEVPIL